MNESEEAVAEIGRLRRQNALLQEMLNRLEHEVAAAGPVIAEVKRLKIWDFTPYRIAPDESWVAVDRASAVALMKALSGTDHWHPWQSRIEPRTQL